MTLMNPSHQRQINLYQTHEYECSYYGDRLARNLVVDPETPHVEAVYQDLLAKGYRRSGRMVYRPFCEGCQACVPARIDVRRFVASRNKKRLIKRADQAGLRIQYQPAKFDPKHFALYQRYLKAVHPGGGMDDPEVDDYIRFLLDSPAQTDMLIHTLGGKPVAVAVTDRTPSALSAVYTFYDPDLSHLSLGTLSVLRQIGMAQRHAMDWLYLGYFIDGHPKMHYKSQFSGLMYLKNDVWVDAK